jgi:hypothetical protein
MFGLPICIVIAGMPKIQIPTEFHYEDVKNIKMTFLQNVKHDQKNGTTNRTKAFNQCDLTHSNIAIQILCADFSIIATF